MANEKEQKETVETVQTQAPVTTEKTLNALKCLDITKVPGKDRPYNNTKEGSRYEGLFYRTYLYEGKAFTVPTVDTFNTLFDEGTLGEVKLLVTPEGTSFLSSKSQRAMMNAKRFKVMEDALTVDFVQSKLTLEDLEKAW